MLVRNASPRGPMCFRCLVFSLSGPCELLFLLLFYCLLDPSCGECYVISLYFVCCSLGVSVCLVCCVLDSVCELFGERICNMFYVVAILLLNFMDVFSVCGVPLLDRPCMVFRRICVLCL